MKISTYFFLIIFIFLSGCGIKTITAGLENEAYLQFVGPVSKYSGGVDVIIDDKINFRATVIKDKIGYMKGKVYAISTGTHNLKVLYEEKVLYVQQIYVAAQETKKIVLP